MDAPQLTSIDSNAWHLCICLGQAWNLLKLLALTLLVTAYSIGRNRSTWQSFDRKFLNGYFFFFSLYLVFDMTSIRCRMLVEILDRFIILIGYTLIHFNRISCFTFIHLSRSNIEFIDIVAINPLVDRIFYQLILKYSESIY